MSEPIFDQLETVMKAGTEAEAKQFVLDHINEFPEDAREAFAVGLFEDALQEENASAQEVLNLRELTSEAADAIEKKPQA